MDCKKKKRFRSLYLNTLIKQMKEKKTIKETSGMRLKIICYFERNYFAISSFLSFKTAFQKDIRQCGHASCSRLCGTGFPCPILEEVSAF